MTLRRFLFLVHQYLGLFALLFLVLAGATGSIIVFRDELDKTLNSDLFHVEGARPAPPLEVADRVQAERPDLWVTVVHMRGREDESLRLGVEPLDAARPLGYDDMFVHPADGTPVGQRQNAPGWGRHNLVAGIFIFHADLLAGDVGRILMGFVAVAWTLSAIAGLYLTFPQMPPFWERWKSAWTFSFKSRLPRLMLDLHKSSGLWLFPFVLLLGLTSVALNFYYEITEPTVLALSPASPSPFDPGARSVPPGHRPELRYADILPLAEKAAAARAPNLEPTFASYFPHLGLYAVSYVTRGQSTYSDIGPVAFYFDDRSGEMVYADDPYRDGAGRALLRTIYPLHSGYVWGWPTRLIVLILGLATVEMSITGLYVWWRRQGRYLFGRNRQATPDA